MDQKNAKKAATLLEKGLKIDETMKHIANLHKKLSKGIAGDLVKIWASVIGLGAGIGIIVQYFKNKTKKN